MAALAPSSALPVAIYVSFSGARYLVDPDLSPQPDISAFEAEVYAHLSRRLALLRQELELGPQHFFCGISQIAIGADTLFTRVCAEQGIPQRIFLPQHRDEYLSATGSNGRPDFTESERVEAAELLKQPHIVQIEVVSQDGDRGQRFRDAQLETVRVSDLLICLVRSGMTGKPGGTPELIEIAKKRGLPTLVMEVSLLDGRPVISETWHHREAFRPPNLPRELAPKEQGDGSVANPLPEVKDYCIALKTFGSHHADWQRTIFRRAAAIIIGTHIAATICAVVAMFLGEGAAVLVVLGVELVLLLSGFLVHQYLHKSQASLVWARARTIAEISRSVSVMADVPIYLEYLFTLPFPDSLSPMLRTLNVLHLRSSGRVAKTETWQQRRDRYLNERLISDETKGQIAYQKRVLKRSSAGLKFARNFFLCCSALAFLASAFKLSLLAGQTAESTAHGLGAFAIVLPVLAVAGLSLAGAFDLEARVHTAKEMLHFLEKQVEHLKNAASEREVEHLLVETEGRLLSETATWYSRRSFTGVA